MGALLLWSAGRRAAKILASPRLADGAEERQLTWALAGLAAGTAVLFAWSIAAGMAVMAFLVYMNRTFVLVGRGYPAAPRTSARVEPALSEVEGNPRPTAFDHIALSIGIGWAISSLILRYGGLRPYRTLRPAFLGMIIGEFAAASAGIPRPRASIARLGIGAARLAVDGVFQGTARDLFSGPRK